VISGLEKKNTVQVGVDNFLAFLYANFLRFITVKLEQGISRVRNRM